MGQEAIFSTYLKDLAAVARRGDAQEESFYPALGEMLGAIAKETGRAHVHVTTLPRPTEGGNPDFRLWNGKDRIVGYQVCQKWLKDRKERRLGLDDIRAYCRIVTALGRSLTIQHQIDALYPEAESAPL